MITSIRKFKRARGKGNFLNQYWMLKKPHIYLNETTRRYSVKSPTRKTASNMGDRLLAIAYRDFLNAPTHYYESLQKYREAKI